MEAIWLLKSLPTAKYVILFLSGLQKEGEFRQFDVVTDPSDHHYLKKKTDGTEQSYLTNSGSDVCKNIMKEWKLLDKNLPDTIFVRAYEDRIDLLRAVIIGAQGTPYHDGLFFFDIKFPFDYPNSPPMVHYRALGMALNPNLYSYGLVCLSLLNTWFGDENESWCPNKSTILQVLVSLQGLVLNEKPFYNEPGKYKPAPSWQDYNQQVFTLSCKTMLFLLRNPPKHFEIFVAAHFRERAYAILTACKAYRNGSANIGGISSMKKFKLSVLFKDSMKIIYPELFAAFIRNGASLQDLIEEDKMINHRRTKEKKSKSIAKFFGKFSCLYVCVLKNCAE
ncbi:hypothetical protein Pint_24329 [Pistacia integerrima]|uniref:Uncharacterized protein n=1 Tax=Pistacia integerrima TaxID=434235 RepID=A0ACC0YGA0_9ROSI|nr:hypothetical protein Pint_24329 [Pistacia integerrima]